MSLFFCDQQTNTRISARATDDPSAKANDFPYSSNANKVNVHGFEFLAIGTCHPRGHVIVITVD